MRVGRCPMVLDLDVATYVSYLSLRMALGERG